MNIHTNQYERNTFRQMALGQAGEIIVMLQQFLTLTDGVSDRDLRPALALALGTQVPRDRQGYARFYHRVLDELDSLELVRLSEAKALDPRRPGFHWPISACQACTIGA